MPQGPLVKRVAQDGGYPVKHAHAAKLKNTKRCEAEGMAFVPLVVDTSGAGTPRLGRQLARNLGGRRGCVALLPAAGGAPCV